MALSFSTLAIQTPAGPRTALVIVPTEDIIVRAHDGGRPGQTMSKADREIFDAARAMAGSHQPTVSIFSARNPQGHGSYRFDPRMSDDDAVAVATRMLSGQLMIYREMIRLGMCLFLHVDLNHKQVHGFRTSLVQRVEELEREVRGTPQDDPIAQVDLWLLRNLSFFFTLSFEKLVETILPEKLTLMEKRMDRIQRLMAKLPPTDMT